MTLNSAKTEASITFLLDENLGLFTGERPWSDILAAAGIKSASLTDLVRIDEMVANHEPDIAYIPSADFHRLVGKGDRHYRGLAIATSKFTGQPNLRSLLVVRRDDPAHGLDDLSGARYDSINKSCSSSSFPPAILLEKKGKTLDDFLQLVPVKPGRTWQGFDRCRGLAGSSGDHGPLKMFGSRPRSTKRPPRSSANTPEASPPWSWSARASMRRPAKRSSTPS